MKVSEHWLKTLIDPKVTFSQLANQLTLAGIELDGSEKVAGDSDQAVWTLKIPPNRGDCLSMEGIAREISLLNAMPFLPVLPASLKVEQQKTVPIVIENPELCPRYLGCCITDVNAKAVIPSWLKNRLEWAGIRSISIIVDILNYVMLEVGQPFHAFDLDKLTSEMVIRNSVKGESLQLIDAQQIELNPGTLVIADKSKVLALAGIMGGLYSAVEEITQSVFIECAYFNPIAVRLASQAYGIRTEGSIRFERGVDPTLQNRALNRAIELIKELAGGKVGPVIEKQDDDYIPKAPTVVLRKTRLQQLLGVKIPNIEIQNTLKQAGIRFTEEKDTFTTIPPSFRQDIALEVDLIEEIARVHGLDSIPSKEMTGALEYPLKTKPETVLKEIKSLFVARGYCEAITYSFIDPAISELLSLSKNTLTISNPIATNLSVMRESLWPGLLQAIQFNLNRQCSRVRLFETGTCFKEEAGKILESQSIAGVCIGSLYKEQWGAPTRPSDFYDLKSDIEALLALFNLNEIQFKKSTHPLLHPGQSAEILVGNKNLGCLGALHPRISKAMGIDNTVYLFECHAPYLLKAKLSQFETISKYPSIRRDIAIVINQEVLAEDLKSAIIKIAGSYLEDLLIFDVYAGKGIQVGKKSIAIGLILRHSSRTLVESEVVELMDNVMTMLKNEFQATLRE